MNIPFLNWKQTFAEFITSKTNYGGAILIIVGVIYGLKGNLVSAGEFIGMGVVAWGLRDKLAE